MSSEESKDSQTRSVEKKEVRNYPSGNYSTKVQKVEKCKVDISDGNVVVDSRSRTDYFPYELKGRVEDIPLSKMLRIRKAVMEIAAAVRVLPMGKAISFDEGSIKKEQIQYLQRMLRIRYRVPIRKRLENGRWYIWKKLTDEEERDVVRKSTRYNGRQVT